MEPDEDSVIIITEDRWVIEGGVIDVDDRKVMEEASGTTGKKPIIMNIRRWFSWMQKHEPKKAKKFHKLMEKEAGHRLSKEEFIEFSSRANSRMDEYINVTRLMDLGQAVQLRVWRCVNHMSWRSVARAAYYEGWFGKAWLPASNQIMGMALCSRAALLLHEDYRKDPWN